MDALLQQKVEQLPDERTALFALIDRFSGAIVSYQKQYASIVSSRDKDLQDRKANMQKTLSTLKNDHAGQQTALKKKHESELASIDRRISDCRRQASTDLTLQDSLVNEKEQEVLSRLASQRESDKRTANGYREVKEKISETIKNVRVALGQTSKGAYRLDRITDSFSLSSTVKDHSSALQAVKRELIDKAKQLYEEILRITESLPRKIIFHKKRTALIKELMQLETDANAAVKVLEDQINKEQLQRQNKGNDEIKRFRDKCNERKQQIGLERDRKITALNTERSNSEKSYSEALKRLLDSQKLTYTQTEASHKKQILDASSRWEKQLSDCSRAFQVNMEKQFPAKQMNAWLKQFWLHPDKVENYTNQGHQLNTIIGIAEVDVSSWFSGATGSVIGKVLTNYIWLFGTNSKWANRCYSTRKLNLPYTMSIEKGTSIHISCADGTEERGKSMLNAIGMRMLRSVPACQMRFQLIDHSGIGAFGQLLSIDPATVVNPGDPIVKSIAIGENGNVHSTVKDIAQQIAETKITMDSLSKDLTGCSSIRHFNLQNPLSKQIYRPILMMNFPLGLGSIELQTLQAMHNDCASWGFSMVLIQPDKALKGLKPEVIEKIKDFCSGLLCLRIANPTAPLTVLNSNSPTERKAQIKLFALPNTDTLKQVAIQYRKESVEASKIQINFTGAKGVYPNPAEWYKASADSGVVIPVGYLEGGQPLRLQFDDVHHVHTVIMGNTGSGKTNLLHVLITNLMLRYRPEEVQVYLIDFKYGLDFRIYTRFYLPNFRAISVTSDAEFALAILRDLENQQKQRSNIMGSKYQKISDYNASGAGKKMGRIFLIVDELYELVKRAQDDVQKEILQRIDSFAHQTRAFGLNMIISGQDLDKIDGFETVVNQCSTRIAMHCKDDQVEMLLGDAGVTRMHTIDETDVGACVVSLSDGNNPQIERTTFIGSGQLEQLLSKIQENYLQTRSYPKPKVLLTKVSDDPNHPIQLFVTQGLVPDNHANKLMVGEPISMERSLNLCPEGNMWIAGGYQTEKAMDAAESLLFFTGVSLLMSKLKYENSDIICSNCADNQLRTIDEEEKDYIGQLASNYPKLFSYYKADQLRQSLNLLLKELDDRRNGKSCKRAIWWILLMPELLSDFANDPNFVVGLREILSSSYEHNIHVVVWTANPKKAQELQLNQITYKDKICLEMSNEDVKLVVGTELQGELSDYKAIHLGSNRMRFHIYEIPDGMWMNQFHERLKRYNPNQ